MPVVSAPAFENQLWTREKCAALDRSTDAWDRFELLEAQLIESLESPASARFAK